MKYVGPLYGKVAGKYFPTGKTSEDWDELERWKKRCELAEAYISKTPCDPDLYEDQFKTYQEWESFKDNDFKNGDSDGR